MSKSTNRYGKIRFSASNTGDGTVAPSKKLQRQKDKLDHAALKMTACKDKGCCGRRYDDLTDKEKVELHLQLNLGREQARDKEDAEAMEEECRSAAMNL